ncbi:autotransporter domain-containing protein [Gallibacterium anatis]|uniref:autotransporter domain-containing protein n=1 Tax=Gallibacterium anatis TaxID=750 RepID=UPI00068AE4A5|nr:autotransporter domain-containing protein [Gallibacterium anatis]
MKKHVLALSVSIILISNIYSIKAEAEIPEKLIIFGDSLSDNGNILRFTLNQENVYNEYLANYFGYSSPRHDGNFFTKRNQDGPNYALGGAVANNNLGGLSGFMSPKISDEIQNYLKSNRNLKDRDTKYVFWIGGNDLRLADDDIKLNTYSVNTDQSNNEKILGSIQAVEQQIRKLLVDAKAKFLIVPNAPNIGNTPNFINNFLADGEIYYRGYKKLAGCNGGGWKCFWGTAPKVSKEELIRFLDDQKHLGKSARDVIHEMFEYAVRKHYSLKADQPLTWDARNELDLWKERYDLVFQAETSLVNTFNRGVDNVIEYFKKHPDYQDVTFIRPDIQLLLDEVIDHYQDFGFNNVVGSPAESFTSGVVGKGAGSGRIAAFEPKDGVRGQKDKEYLWNKGYKYVFADQFHPSPKTHRMIYDYIASLLESESGDPIDMNVKRISTTPFSSTDRKIYHSAEDDGVFNTTYVPGVNQITKSDLDIYNDGRALFAADGGVIRLTNTNITSQGRLGGIINAEQRGKIYLTNGSIDIYRTNPYAAPFGVMVNGDGSLVQLDNIRLNTYGKETTTITVGNNAEIHLINSTIKSNGTGANVLNLWDSKATIINSILKTDSDKASAVKVFANDSGNQEATLVADGSTFTSENHYAIKVAENATRNPAILSATLTNSVVNGDIYTSEPINNRFLHSKSYFTFDKNSSWNMRGNSNVTSISLKDSTLNLSQSSDNWNAKTLSIANDFITQNSYIRLGTDLSDDNSKTDKIVVKGISILNANLYIDKRNSSLGSSTQAGIKVIDLNGDKSNTGTISLAKEINAGIYQYLLTHGGIGADDQSDWYLTSSYIKHNDQATPVIIKPENTGTTDRSSNVPKENRPTEGVAKPTETAQPAQPTEAVAKPTEPAQPAQPTGAVAKPVETAQPAQPTEAVAKPAEPAQPTQPTEAVAKPAETAQPAQPTEAVAKLTEPVQPAQPTEEIAKPAEPAQPAQPTEEIAKPAETAQPAQPTEAVAKPTEPAQPEQPTEAVAKPTEPAQPAQPTEAVAKPTEPAQPAQPTEAVAKLVETAQPAQPTEEIAKPAETTQPTQPTKAVAKPAESEIKPILNKDATLFSALPYISQSVGERHLEYSVRNPNVPLWGRKDGLDYWVNMAYIYNQVKGKDFLNLQQNAQILAMGKDLVTTDNTLFGISSTYSRTNTSVDNYSNCQLGLHCASGKVTSEMISINGYYLYDWGNWYVQTVLSAGKVKHKFKNSSNFTYGINGYIISSEQTLGYRYPLNENLALYSDIGLQETYHRYSSTSVEEIHVDKINQYNVNALMNVGIQYQVEAFTLSSNLRVIKNLHDFNYLKMNNVNIQDKFAKDRASLSTNARYYITDNVSLFMNFEYLRSLNNDRINKFKQLNYQVGVNIQF